MMVGPQLPEPVQQNIESQANPFSCNICHKTYTRVDHLARHVRSHTQEKPFSCPVCGKSFARADLLKRHSTNHEDSPDGRKKRRLNQPQSRVAQACVACATSKLRCDGDQPCKRCDQKKLECRYNRPRTSIIQDDLLNNEDVESTSTATHEDWHSQPRPQQTTVSPHHYHHHAISPSHSRGEAGESFNDTTTLPLAQPPMQLLTPSSPAVNINTFPESMYDVAPGMNQYDTSFADFLKDVMMPEQMNNNTPQNNFGQGKQFQTFDLLNFAGNESSIFFPEEYNTYVPLDSSELNTAVHRSENNLQANSSGHATPSGAGGIRLGAQAFKDSVWLYAPSQHHRVGADESNMFLPLENLVSKTKYRGIPPCHDLAQAVRDRILATVLAESSNSIVPDVVSSFPSAELLTNLIHQFLVKHEKHDDAWIHTATFDPNQQHPQFLMSLIAAGASLSDMPQIRNLGYAFQESARRSVTEQIERDNRTIRHLRPLQTYALQLDVGLWSGDRRRMELSESHALILATMMRRGGFFRQTTVKFPLPDLRDSAEVTENKWKLWVERESFKRLAFHLLIRDAQTSITLIMPPMISPSEMMVELPSSSDLWRAKTAFEWRDLYVARYSGPRSPIPTLRAATDDFSLVANFLDLIDVPLTNLLVLCSMWSLSWQYRELIRLNVSNPGGNSSLITKSLYQEIVQALQRFRLYSSDWTSGIQPLAIILHERVLLNLHTSLEDVQLFAGKAGEEEARRVYPLLAAWAHSREARQAVWHAGQIFKAAKGYPKQTLQEFSAVSLYHASLIFWAYSVISSQSPPLPHLSPRENQQIVFVDGDDNSYVQRFIVLGKGSPALDSSTNSAEKRVVSLSDAKATMVAITDLLKQNNGGKDEELSPLVSNLSKLMRSLGNAAKGIKASQSSAQSTTT